jgi:hypothetical protein
METVGFAASQNAACALRNDFEFNCATSFLPSTAMVTGTDLAPTASTSSAARKVAGSMAMVILAWMPVSSMVGMAFFFVGSWGCSTVPDKATTGRLGCLQNNGLPLGLSDTLAVWKLDRLGRSVKQLVDLIGDLHSRGVQFKSLTDAIDTGTPSGRFFFHVMASLAEMERELTAERTRAGLEIARQRGRKGGRRPKMTRSKIESAKKLLASGIPPKDVARNLGVSIPTLYRWVPASDRV